MTILFDLVCPQWGRKAKEFRLDKEQIELVDCFIVWVDPLSVHWEKRKNTEIEKLRNQWDISRKLIFYIKLILTLISSIYKN